MSVSTMVRDGQVVSSGGTRGLLEVEPVNFADVEREANMN